MKRAGLLSIGIAGLMLGISLLDGKKKMKLEPVTPLDNPRQSVVDAAVSQLGVQNPSKYWDEVLPAAPGFKGDWCGGFALWAIHQARLARDVNWEIGKGFCYRLPVTNQPAPGDVAYFDKPYQHHAIVESVGDYMVTTIDGNQPGSQVVRRTRPISQVTAFFSIEPFIAESHSV